jgi:PIN domain nuclease of toxin-antitoxin system
MKGLLLDTHIFLWWLADSSRLSERFRQHIADPATPCYISAATIWEIGIERAIGKLDAPSKLITIVEEEGFHGLPMTLVHAEAASVLPLYHHDPFDRMLIAQAQVESLVVVTVDKRFLDYDLELL